MAGMHTKSGKHVKELLGCVLHVHACACLYVHRHVETGYPLLAFSSMSLHFIFLKQGLSLSLELTNLAAWPASPGDAVSASLTLRL